MGKLTQRMSTFLLPTSVRLAWLNLLRNGRRSLLSVLIIAIAVFA
ncbi:ABC transporter permease, partial [Vibrio cyclitrophicus]